DSSLSSGCIGKYVTDLFFVIAFGDKGLVDGEIGGNAEVGKYLAVYVNFHTAGLLLAQLPQLVGVVGVVGVYENIIQFDVVDSQVDAQHFIEQFRLCSPFVHGACKRIKRTTVSFGVAYRSGALRLVPLGVGGVQADRFDGCVNETQTRDEFILRDLFAV